MFCRWPDGQLLAGSAEWIDVEFKAALDSGCTDHVRAPDDISEHALEEIPGSWVFPAFCL